MDKADGVHKHPESQSLGTFIESVVGNESLRVEEDFGGGFVRLKHSEAELRQAAQDIQCSEDIIIELLRNSRDAHAVHIYLAFRKIGNKRYITVIDDGCGVPPSMHERIFQPRVTSKLDSAKADRWGMHGRGMALFSITKNAERAAILASSEGLGTALEVITDTDRLPEKTDQSTFPHFETKDGVSAMRGPKNIFRTVAEFALDQRSDLTVYCGSETEIVAALFERGMKNISPSKRIFDRNLEDVSTADLLGMATDPKMLAELSKKLGIEISERSARRIMDRQILSPAPILDRIAHESFASPHTPHALGEEHVNRPLAGHASSRPKISGKDLAHLTQALACPLDDIARGYYLTFDEPKIVQRKDKVMIEIPFID